MNVMIAYCGLDCNTCPIHLATLEQNNIKRRLMRENITQICNKQYNMNLQIQDINDCDGCRIDKRLFSGCTDCKIRKCAVEKKVESCAFCDKYSCANLRKHFDNDPSAKTRLEEMRSIIE